MSFGKDLRDAAVAGHVLHVRDEALLRGGRAEAGDKTGRKYEACVEYNAQNGFETEAL